MQRLEPDEIENQVFPLARRGYDKDKVDSFLRVVAAYYREAIRLADPELGAPQVVTPPPQPASAAPQPASKAFGDVGEQIAAILRTAERAAEDLAQKAEREVQNMRRAAADEAAEVTQSATNQLAMARQLKADAQQEAESVLLEARDEAIKLKQDAHAVAARLEQNARDRAAKLEQAANAKVSSILAEARRRYDILRTASHQSSVHLRSVEAMIRLAREELTGRGLPIDVEELSPGGLSDAHDEGALPAASTATEPAEPTAAEPAAAEPTAPEPVPEEPAPVAPVENGAFPDGDTRTEDLISDVLEPEPDVVEAKPTRRKKAGTEAKARPRGTGAPRRNRASGKSRSAEEPE